MAPIRKSRNLNKLSSKSSKDSHMKDAGNGGKGRKQKGNASDPLGCPWSKEELGRFYEAYRKYGKNWKKVAGIVRGRSVEMVEALYNMNRAYLSLPEGTASVVGLIAMMTDHYNISDSDESERESNEEPIISQEAQKRDRGKSRIKVSNSSAGHVPHMLHSQAVSSSYGCLPLLKNKCSNGSGPRIVGKRTPRVPVAHPHNKGDVRRYLSPRNRETNLEEDVNTDEVAQGVSALTKVLQGEGSSQIPNRRNKHTSLSPVRDYGKIHAKAELVWDTHVGAAKGDCLEGNLGIRTSGNADSARDIVNSVEVCRKRRPSYKMRPDLQDMKSDHSFVRGKMNKRSRQLLSEDESYALDALNALADAVPMLELTTTLESGPKEKGGSHTMAKEDLARNVGLLPEVKQQVHQSTSGMKKRKHKSSSSKIPKAQSPMNSLLRRQQKSGNPKADSPVDCIISEQQKTERKSVGHQESASPREDLRRQGNHLALPMVQVPAVNQVYLPSKRKINLQKTLVKNRMKSPDNIGIGESNDYSYSLHDKAHSLKEKLSHCLSSQTLQKWCTFEWFYSAIDYPWFAKREFVEYLNHVGLGHVPKLTRVEWGVIRSSLGKPRRLSQQFLREEKDKLEQYRESVRIHYAQLRSGIIEVIPSDLAQPLRVGQRVIARHPKRKGIYNGSILTVERDKFRVQFDSLELGVEFVMDIDCMPLDLMDNMPEDLRKENIVVDKDQESFNESMFKKIVGHLPSENLESADDSPLISSTAHLVNPLLKLAKGGTIDGTTQKSIASKSDNAQEVTQSQACSQVPIQSQDAEIQALCDLSRALDKKGLLVSELRYMNSEILEHHNDGNESLRDSEFFKKQYASVLLQLKEVNDQVSAALLHLRQRSTYQENTPHPWLKPARSSSSALPHSCFDHSAVLAQESGSNVVEVVETSRGKALEMVDAAAQAMSSLKEDEDVYMKIREALDCANRRDFAMRFINPSNSSHHGLPYQNQATACMVEQRTADQTTDSKLNNVSEIMKVPIPSALISSCVSTLLMIQTCTDRQYAPAEAAEILDSAIRSLQPSCSQNVPIFRDIQMCMGMVKNQILALIPT